jgi:uncharacterized protein with von Willebrand factor type A (vWA) domain
MREFDAKALDREYDYVDTIPDALFEQVMAARHGQLEDIARSVVTFREALLEGRLPEVDDLSWPDAELRRSALECLDALEVARFCEDQTELADSLISSVLEAFDEGRELQLARFKKELESLVDSKRRERLKEAGHEGDEIHDGAYELFQDSEYSDWNKWCDELDTKSLEMLVEIDSETLDECRAKANQRATDEGSEHVEQVILDEWREIADAWRRVARVFTDLSEMLGRGWDFARGLVDTDGWMELEAMRELVEEIPELEELIQTLGRLQTSDEEEESVSETILESVRQSREEIEMTPTPRAPVETRGVRRSDDITRMLPIEALKLTQPNLSKLFHAKRFEHALATYRVEGVMPERIEVEEDVQEEIERDTEEPKDEEGPIIVCLDTSGSMRGTPERIAKALTLETVRVAHQEGRRCFVYAFSGPNQFDGLEISLERESFVDFISFLRRSFHGGTDVEAPLRRATERLSRENWTQSDLLLVSDGKFPVSDELSKRLKSSREQAGATLHGVLVGATSSHPMDSLCDELHRFGDWESLDSSGI